MTKIIAMYLISFATAGSAGAIKLQKQVFEPCGWWRYDFEIKSYVCRRPLPAVTVYDANEVDAHINRLETLIQSLEERVKNLEGK